MKTVIINQHGFRMLLYNNHRATVAHNLNVLEDSTALGWQWSGFVIRAAVKQRPSDSTFRSPQASEACRSAPISILMLEDLESDSLSRDAQVRTHFPQGIVLCHINKST